MDRSTKFYVLRSHSTTLVMQYVLSRVVLLSISILLPGCIDYSFTLLKRNSNILWKFVKYGPKEFSSEYSINCLPNEHLFCVVVIQMWSAVRHSPPKREPSPLAAGIKPFASGMFLLECTGLQPHALDYLILVILTTLICMIQNA